MRQIQPAVGQNFLAGMVGGVQAGQQMRQANDQNALRNLLAGADLNDPALAAQVAQYDPQMGMQMNQQNYQRERQERADARADQLFDMQVAEFAQNADDREKAEAAQMIEQGLIKGTQLFRAGDLQGLNMMLAEAGEQPISSLEEFPAIAAKYERVWETLQRTQPEVRKPMSGPGKVQADIDAGLLPAGTELRSPQVQLNMGNQNPMPGLGKLPAGQTYLYNQDGTVRVDERGVPMIVNLQTPEEVSASKAAQSTKATTEANRADVVKRATSSIREKVSRNGFFDLPEVGIVGARLAEARLNQEAVDVAADIETLKGMVVFDRLERLREASANGSSGLGQVTNVEIGLLGAQLGALRQDMSKEAILETLDTLDRVFGKLSPEAQAYLLGQGDDGFINSTQASVAQQGSSGQISMTPEQQSVFDRYSR